METIDTLSQQLGDYLAEHQLSVTTAESCTGGGIAQAITRVAGSSSWFSHGFVTYSNQAKEQLLGVSNRLLREHGAVSQEVVESMAIGALDVASADLAVAVSGIAGPGGGSEQKPVGTVWLGFACMGKPVKSQCFLFSGDRESVRNQSVIEALKGLIAIA